MKTSVFLLLSSLFLALAPASPAATIWDNGGPDQVNGVFSDFDFGNQQGDDFTVAATATARQIQWWGGYAFSNTPTTPDDFTIRFFTITGGIPDSVPFLSYAVGNVGRVDSGLDVVGFDIYSFSATIPDTLLAPGSYLLSVVNNTVADADDNWFWATSSQSGTGWFRFNDGEFWVPQNFELAFNISGSFNDTGVPDAGASALLFGVALAGLFFVQRVLGWRSVAVQ